jgi:hypothetical protein
LHPDVIPPASRFDAYWLVLVGTGLEERPDKVVLDGQLLQVCIKPVRLIVYPDRIGLDLLKKVLKDFLVGTVRRPFDLVT